MPLGLEQAEAVFDPGGFLARRAPENHGRPSAESSRLNRVPGRIFIRRRIAAGNTTCPLVDTVTDPMLASTTLHAASLPPSSYS